MARHRQQVSAQVVGLLPLLAGICGLFVTDGVLTGVMNANLTLNLDFDFEI